MGARSSASDVAGGVIIEIQRHGDAATRRSKIARSIFNCFFLAFFAYFAVESHAQNVDSLALAIRTGTTEQKRDALFQIRNLKSEIASRTALPALKDSDPIIRATAAASVVFLPKQEAIAALSPLLADKDAFVRKEAAYALGNTESPEAAAPLIDLLRREKDLEAKAAAAVGLGHTGNPLAVEPLLALLRRGPREDEEFLRRSAARSIGQIAQIIKTSKAYVVTPQNFLPEKFKQLSGDDLTTRFPVFSSATLALSTILQNKNEANDTRREAAFALGSIGSRSAANVLQARSFSNDPYLAEISKEALLKLEQAGTK